MIANDEATLVRKVRKQISQLDWHLKPIEEAILAGAKPEISDFLQGLSDAIAPFEGAAADAHCLADIARPKKTEE